MSAAPRGFARLTPAQRAEVSRKGGRAAQASGYANQFTKRAARAAGRKSTEKWHRECSYCAHRDTCPAAIAGVDCGPGRPSWKPLP